MQSPGGRRKAAPSVTAPAPVPAPAVSVLEDEMAGLSVPTSFGMFKQFNYTTRKTTTSMLVRLILHNGIAQEDVEFEWLTPCVLKLRVARPEWFQNTEQMAEFTTDDQDNIVFPPEHPLTMDTSERNQQLVEEDGKIWDNGVMTFDQDMKIDDVPVFVLLDVNISSRATTIKVLQIMVT